jgi:hypothetical protein
VGYLGNSYLSWFFNIVAGDTISPAFKGMWYPWWYSGQRLLRIVTGLAVFTPIHTVRQLGWYSLAGVMRIVAGNTVYLSGMFYLSLQVFHGWTMAIFTTNRTMARLLPDTVFFLMTIITD